MACTLIPQTTYTVCGSVTGLNGGASVTLTDSGTDNLKVTASGAFTFGQALFNAAAYQVTVLMQPTGQTCSVTNGAGAVNAADVTAVAINCVSSTPPTTYTVGGSVNGLPIGQSLHLNDNGGDTVSVSANGPFQFPTALGSGGAYSVTIATPLSGKPARSPTAWARWPRPT